MESVNGFSDEEWILTPLLCAHQAKIPLELRWGIWENTTLSDQEKVPIYKYWADQFSGDTVTDEEIAVSGDVLFYPDEKTFYKMDTEDPSSNFVKVSLPYEPELFPSYWRPDTSLKISVDKMTGQGDGFVLYGEPYQDPYNPYDK